MENITAKLPLTPRSKGWSGAGEATEEKGGSISQSFTLSANESIGLGKLGIY